MHRVAKLGSYWQEVASNVKMRKHSFFSTNKKPVTQHHLAMPFLLNTAHGKEDEAKQIVARDPDIVRARGNFKDFSGRYFPNTLAAEYAYWALDYHMLVMLLPYHSDDEIKRILEGQSLFSSVHGYHYDFNEIINPLEIYLSHFSDWSDLQLGEYWCHGVGGAQAKTVAHVANQYCHPRYSFENPNFLEPKLPRHFKVKDDIDFFPVKETSIGVLGRDFAVFRWNKDHAGIGTIKPCPNAKITAETDLQALKLLRDTRLMQIDELKQQYGVRSSKRHFKY